MTKPTNRPPIKQPGENIWEFRLGDHVKDKVSGLIGTATARLYHRTGCDRFIVELPSREGAEPVDLILDAGRLTLVQENPELHREDEVPDVHFKLGDEARDIMAGLSGRIGVIKVPLFGAIMASIDPEWDAEKKVLPEGFFCDAHMVEVIEPYDNRPKKETKPTPAQKKKQKPGACRVPTRSIG